MSILLSDEPSHIPPVAVAQQAAKGLELQAKFKRGGTRVGWARARGLKERLPLDAREIKKIYSYFARHAVDKSASHFGDDHNPSKGYIAWLLWGGDEGAKWVKGIRKQLDSSE